MYSCGENAVIVVDDEYVKLKFDEYESESLKMTLIGCGTPS